MNQKKMAVAMAVVFAHIKRSEEAAACNVPEISGPVQMLQPLLHQGMIGIWGVSGRQVQMQTHSMMQLRMFK